MAEENLLVEQRKVPTAYFDTDKRIVVLPILKEDLSVNVADLLTSHEVSHAIHTDSTAWKSALESGIRKSVLNTVEDARIERLIKKKYPGLRTIYHQAYKELMAIDFFGLKKMNVNNLNLIDRINLNAKIGFLSFIKFTEEEQEFVNLVEQVVTMDDVIVVSKQIQEYMKKQKEKKQEEHQDLDDVDSDIQLESEEETEDNGFGNSEDEDEDDFDWDDMSNEWDDEDKDLDSNTQLNAEKNVQRLYSESNKESVYIDIPDFDLSQLILDYKDVLNQWKDHIKHHQKFRTVEIPDLYGKFLSQTNSSVQYMIKEFTLKKSSRGTQENQSRQDW